MKRRTFYKCLSAIIIVGTAGCSDSSGGSNPSETDSGNPNSESGSDGEDDSTSPDSNVEKEFDETTPTGELLLNSFEVPDGFTFYDETLTTISDLSEDDATYDFFSEENIVRRHRRQFIDWDTPADSALIIATITVHESSADARTYRDNRIDSFDSDSSMETNEVSTYRVPTVVGRNESDSGITAVYFVLVNNAVYQLLFTDVSADLDTDSVYERLLEKL